ncbi:hypothetical protein SYNPS1DRAFT_22524 [Syncephalis pseudoplumigaleata]|uniref:Wax synthase domain-containing protein n=1 Tax=Syncephalis pseudoplumigaleata TaxID=1712513 RepID=A0A4P9Z1B6_9FUNG|nr:hypothetical protein SYNPS1DRAFT_22524 [Syncephalis pseudoplumigaleata]|eukprot:RKP25531.1 hypothetical protein SYNPS1DRAFT_22524 [Syncephalis pseudoplumigaleata]
METLLDPGEPYFRVDLGTHLPMPIYFSLVGLHMVAHYKLLAMPNLSRAFMQWATSLIVVSLVLLPLWRGVNPEHPLVDMGVSFGCVFSAIRVALLTAAACRQSASEQRAAIKRALHKKLDDYPSASAQMAAAPAKTGLAISSLGDYIRAMYLDEPAPAAHLSSQQIERSNGRSVASAVDSVQAQLIHLANGYDQWLKSIGWHTLPFWIRYPLSPLAYLLMLQLPLALVVRNVDFLTLYSVDRTAAAYFYGMSAAGAFLRWTLVIVALVFAFYLGMLMWYAIVFDLVQWAVGAPARRDLFRRPWLTSSPRDLWGRRWNLPVQTSLAEAVYQPCCRLLDAAAQRAYALAAGGRQAGLPRPLRRANRFVAGFGVFCLSALIHEYTLSVAFGRSDLDHLRFFCFHGLLTIGYTLLETAACAILPSALMPNASLPFVVGWLLTWICMALSAQWFFMPYIRGGLVDNFVYYAFL